MKKSIVALLIIPTILCPVYSSYGFFFDGTYNYTTSRGDRVGSTAATIGEIGDWVQVLIPLSALAYSTYIGDWQGDKQLAYSVGSSWATTEILKNTIREERPYEPEDTTGKSFPSGHTSFAFSGAAYWQRRYGWEIGAPMYLGALFVGYSRVRVKMHNWTDVAAGAALGIGFNYLFTSRYEETGTSVAIEPTDGGAYLHFSTRF